MILRHFVAHGPFVFFPIVIVFHVQHSPKLHVDVVIRQIEIRAADLLGENPEACREFALVFVAQADAFEVDGDLLLGTTADPDAQFGRASGAVSRWGKNEVEDGIKQGHGGGNIC